MHLLPLIEIHLTVNWQDGWTALMSAALSGHSKVVETLLQHGAKVDMQKEVSTGNICSWWFVLHKKKLGSY